MSGGDDGHSVVSLVNGERLVVQGSAEQVATQLNPSGAAGGGLSVLDGREGEVVLVNSRHVVAVRAAT
jgi:hypothetical protein